MLTKTISSLQRHCNAWSRKFACENMRRVK